MAKNNINAINRAASFNPQQAFPLDKRSYFESLVEAEAAASTAAEPGTNAATNTVYYFGQNIVVNENNKVTCYVIQHGKDGKGILEPSTDYEGLNIERDPSSCSVSIKDWRGNVLAQFDYTGLTTTAVTAENIKADYITSFRELYIEPSEGSTYITSDLSVEGNINCIELNINGADLTADDGNVYTSGGLTVAGSMDSNSARISNGLYTRTLFVENGGQIGGTITPAPNTTWNLGGDTASERVNSVYATNISANKCNIHEIWGSQLTIDSTSTSSLSVDNSVVIDGITNFNDTISVNNKITHDEDNNLYIGNNGNYAYVGIVEDVVFGTIDNIEDEDQNAWIYRNGNAGFQEISEGGTSLCDKYAPIDASYRYKYGQKVILDVNGQNTIKGASLSISTASNLSNRKIVGLRYCVILGSASTPVSSISLSQFGFIPWQILEGNYNKNRHDAITMNDGFTGEWLDLTSDVFFRMSNVGHSSTGTGAYKAPTSYITSLTFLVHNTKIREGVRVAFWLVYEDGTVVRDSSQGYL